MGRGGVRAKVLAVAVLTAAVWPWTAGPASADTDNGISVPDVVFTQGSGDQTVDVTIASNSPVVGFGATISVRASSPYIVRVSGSSVGASCADASGTWTCDADDLRAGAIQVTVSTATPDCSSSGLCLSPLVAVVEGPGGWPTQGSVEIKAKQPPAAPPTSTVVPVRTSSAPVPASTPPAPRATRSKSASPTAAATAEPSTPVASAMLVSAVAAAPSSSPVEVVAVAGAGASSGEHIAEIVIPCVVLLLAAGFFAWRAAVARRRRAGLTAEGTLPQQDPDDASDDGVASE